MNFTILRFDALESTNTEAINQAKRGADEGVCILAKKQTAGRGRHGRTWISEENAGLYFSIILRPKTEIKHFPLITLMTAIAVHDTLENLYALDADIKWVNDIHVNEKKICGILAESVETKKGFAVIVGIGINLKSSNFPPEIAETATSVETETNKNSFETDDLLGSLTRFLNYFYEILHEPDGAKKIVEEWTRRSSYAFGKAVRVKTGTETIIGTTDGIEENGALRVKTETGEIRIIAAGDVENLRKFGRS